LSGSEALNKELSERRAKALYALFTHDADAWEELFSGTADGPNWKEKWDLEEAQHMLNAIGCTDDSGTTLKEDGIRGPRTLQAIHKFQAGNYPDCPPEQAPLARSDYLGKEGRKELFLAYAKRISRKPVDKERISNIGDAKFMGCGEFNPLSEHVRDQESRRAVVFVFDPAAEPQGLPCQLRALGPCQGNCAPQRGTAAKKDAEDDDPNKPPYRCKVYQEIAKCCPSKSGQELSQIQVRLHDDNSSPITTSVPYRVGAGLDANQIRTSTDGWVTISLPKDQCVGRVLLEWGEPDETGAFPYRHTIEVDCSASNDKRTQQRARLRNIGYPDTDSFENSVERFQADYGLSERGLGENGAMLPATQARLCQIYDDNRCDASRDGEMVVSSAACSPDEDSANETDDDTCGAGSCFDGLE
jgi:hypothetical protein